LAVAERLALERLDEVERERHLRTAAEEGLADAVSLALQRLEEMSLVGERLMASEVHRAEALADRERISRELADKSAEVVAARSEVSHAEEHARVQAEATAVMIAQAQARAQSLAQDLDAMRLTLGWRAVARVNGFVARRPRLHRQLRGLRARIGTMLGRRARAMPSATTSS
jgi:hypothetical protein